MPVDTTSYLADAKNVYGAIQDQVNSEAVFMNLLGDGSKFGKPVNDIGIRGYTFLARLGPNWNMGYRPEGYTGTGNVRAQAGNQGLANSTVVLKYAYVPMIITGQAETLTKGEKRAFMQAKALEAKFDMKDIVQHVNVIMVGAERGGVLAEVNGAGAIAAGVVTFTCYLNTGGDGNLPGAKYLRVGMPIDTGPIGGGVTVKGLVITNINYTTGVVTATSDAQTVPAATAPAAGDGVYLSGEAAPGAGSFPFTAEGLISLVASTGAQQGLDPATPGQGPWQSYMEDMAGATVSPSSIMALKQIVKNQSGADVNFWYTSSAQINDLVTIATQLLYFRTDQGGLGKKALDLGFTTFEYGGTAIVEDKDCRDDRWYAGASEMWKKFEAMPLSMADDEAGDWTRISGANGPADAVSGLMRWYHQLGTLQRNSMGVQKNYHVPARFLNRPAGTY